MAFPTLSASNSGSFSGTSGSITYPSSGIANNDYALLHIACDGTVTISSWGGSIFGNDVLYTGNNGANAGTIAWHKCDGTEDITPDSFTLTISAGERCLWQMRIWTGVEETIDPEISTVATGTDDSPDANNLTPSGWSQDDTVWIWSTMVDDVPAVSSYPTNYSSNQWSQSSFTPGGTRLAQATRNANAASENPGAATLASSNDWICHVVAIPPSGASAPGGDESLTGDPGAIELIGASATTTVTLAASPGVLELFGADATFAINLDATPGTIELIGANATTDAGGDLSMTADPGAIVLIGANATLSHDLPTAVRRGGGRWPVEDLPQPDRPTDEVLAEIRDVLAPEIADARAQITASQGVTRSNLRPVSGSTPLPVVKVPAAKRPKIDRLLAEVGISLDEFLAIIL